MKEKEYFIISGVIFIGVILLHGLRVLRGFDLVYGGADIPYWISFLVAIIGIVMAYYGFKLGSKKTGMKSPRKGRR